VSTFSHTDHLDLIVSTPTGSMLPKAARSRKRRRKLAAKHETNSLAAGKKPYRTPGDAFRSRCRIARKWGNRFRRLRVYKDHAVGLWFLTKMTKGQFQGSAARRRILSLACARTRDHARAGAP
jgi:hypothetical protein